MQRADLALVARGLFDSRSQARAAIEAGGVTVNGARVKKPSEKINDTDALEAKAAHSWVSRGGVKLDGALKTFGVDPAGLCCIDIGASTGGFTDVLIARGAAKVYAIDVGTAQLHARLHGHPKIISKEQTDARSLTRADIAEDFDLIVCDASFISAMKVLARPMALAASGCQLICLVKPQFEVGQEGLSKGGIVKDRSLAEDALTMIKTWTQEQGWRVLATCDSPIKGGSGNREFLLHAVKH